MRAKVPPRPSTDNRSKSPDDGAAGGPTAARLTTRRRRRLAEHERLETSWCQLEIEPIDGPDILLNGVVDPARLDGLGRLLGCFGLPYGLELNDENDDLVREISG
ncbi:hypothetical protein ACFU3J_18230 [Streptomyces sp. NPDC057411]|uniref:hypothetical protein n=1 Tax=unclassified Streptomyces TaxID=2593676 RepID=UPI003643712A